MKILNRLNSFILKIAYFAFFYVLLSLNAKIELHLYFLYLSVFFLSFIGIGIFGYIINDISDEKPDKLAGKTNVTANLTLVQKTLIVLFLLVVGVVPITFYAPATIPFIIFEILLLVAYSFPPFRLKEKGIVGVITDSLYAYTIPSVILLVFLNSFLSVNPFFWYFLPLFCFILGIRNILNHQLEDYDNDLIAKTKTFATENQSSAHSFKIIADIISVALWETALVYILLNNFSGVITACFLVVGIVYLIKTILYVVYKEEKYLAGVPEFDLIYYGIIILTVFVLQEKQYQLLFLSVFIFVPLIRQSWHIYVFIRRILSFIVNYTLYYSFLLVGIDLKERARNRKKTVVSVPLENTGIPIELNEKNVHGLWIGNELSLMEMLTIKSFIHHGYIFHIWIYEPLKNELPNECIVKDANDIIPYKKVFKYKYSSQFGTGKGSYAGFSDIFRYKLLYEKGGWWVDMDVTCLKSFDTDAPYFFRSHHDLLMVGNIMKAPKGSELMLKCYEEANNEINENNRDWHKPIAILNKNILELNLERYIVSGATNTDEWYKIKPYVHTHKQLPDEWYFLHWCNEVWRSNGFNKNSPLYSSYYGSLMMEYQLIPSIPKAEWKKHDRKMRIKLIIDKIIGFL